MTSRHERREADLLDESIEALLRGEQPASAHPSLARESMLASTLVAARSDLETEIAPSTAFSSSLRIRLVAEAERMADAARTSPAAAAAPSSLSLAGAAAGVRTRRPRLVAGFIAAALMAGTGAATAAGASSSLPGEALYPLKKGMERLSLVGDAPAEAGRERLEHATTRLDEALALTDRGRVGDEALAADAIAEFAARATEGGAALLAAEVDGQDGSADAVRAFAQESRTQIIALSQTSDGDVFAALKTAADTVYALDSQVEALCPTCSGGTEPLAPFARAAEEAGRVLRGLTGAEVTVEENARDAAERVARETPRKAPRTRQARGGGKQGGSETTGRQEPAPSSPRTTPSPSLPLPTTPAVTVPRLPDLSETPVVGSTLKDVQDVVEDSVVRELEEQVGQVTDDLLGENGLLGGQ